METFRVLNMALDSLDLFDYDTALKSLEKVSETTTVGEGPSWLEFDPTGKFMFK